MQPFPAGKTFKELKLDPTRKFVVVKEGDSLNKGDILVLLHFVSSQAPIFKRLSDGVKHSCWLSNLAYADEERDIITWDNLQVGDRFECTSEFPPFYKGGKYTVLAIVGECVFYSYTISRIEGSDFGLKSFLQNTCTIIQPQPKQRTAEDVLAGLSGEDKAIMKDWKDK